MTSFIYHFSRISCIVPTQHSGRILRPWFRFKEKSPKVAENRRTCHLMWPKRVAKPTKVLVNRQNWRKTAKIGAKSPKLALNCRKSLQIAKSGAKPPRVAPKHFDHCVLYILVQCSDWMFTIFNDIYFFREIELMQYFYFWIN